MITQPYHVDTTISAFYKWRNWGRKGEWFTLNYPHLFHAEVGFNSWLYIKNFKNESNYQPTVTTHLLCAGHWDNHYPVFPSAILCCRCSYPLPTTLHIRTLRHKRGSVICPGASAAPRDNSAGPALVTATLGPRLTTPSHPASPTPHCPGVFITELQWFWFTS